MNHDPINAELESVKAALDTVSPSFCLAKWTQATLHLHSGNTQSCHHVRAHQIDPDSIRANPEALHNTLKKQAARSEMLSGKRPKECSYCWTAEDRGLISDRVLKSGQDWSLPFFQDVVSSGTGPKIRPRYLEVSFDSTCNFRCMYCSPAFSSSWMNEIAQYGPYPTARKFNNLDEIKRRQIAPLSETERARYIEAFWRWWPELSDGLEEFRITGGEPFLAQSTFDVLEWLLENPRPRLGFAINSNMGIGDRKMERALDLISRLKGKVRAFTLYTSIDTVGPRADYIRFGLEHERYFRNVEEYLNSMTWPVSLAYMITVNALSITRMKDLMEIILDQRRRFPQHHILFDTPYLQNPQFLSVEILTPDFVEYFDQTLEFMRAHKEFSELEMVKVNRVRELILKPRHSRLMRTLLRRDFDAYLTEYDRRRETSFADTFPEYAQFREVCRQWSVPKFIADCTF
jgi:organic radical activating enzyme